MGEVKRPKLTVDDFLLIKKILLEWGYRLKTSQELKGDFTRIGIVSLRPRKGRIATFVFYANGLRGVMHTSFDVVNQEFQEGREGWPLITQGDYAKYFSKPLRRTRNFVVQFLRKAWMIRYRVMNRPLCKHCKRFMEIKERYKLNKETNKKIPTGQYYWSCMNKSKHPEQKPEFLGWDKIGKVGKLPPKAQKFVDEMRRRVRSYKKLNAKKGIQRKRMREIRNRWKVTKSENRV